MSPANLFFPILIISLILPLFPAQPYDYPTANLSTLWTNSNASLQHTVTYSDGSTVRAILLRSNPKGFGLCYAAGFFCIPPCNAFLFAVFIIYANSGGGITMPTTGMAQVVWSANWGSLVHENATLNFTSDGVLSLRDSDRSLVWFTNTSDRSVAGMTMTTSGNLVLFDRKNASVWQSFDHPTDSLVPGQPLVEGMSLTPNTSATNWTRSNQLSLTVLPDGLKAYAGSTPRQLYYQKIVTKTGSGRTYMTMTNGTLAILSVPFTPAGPDSVINLQTNGSVQYMRFEADGHLKLYEFGEQLRWRAVQDIFQGDIDDCAYPTVCGEYGICSNGQCTCPIASNSSLTYFKQINDRRIDLGCMSVTPISCQSVQDHQLIAFNDISYFNYIDQEAAVPRLDDEESCKQACMRNCSCKAALFQYGDNTSKGSCFLPSQLFSLRVNQRQLTHYNSSAYLKVQAPKGPESTTPTAKKRDSAGVILGSTLAGVIALVMAITTVLLILRRIRRYEEIDEEDEFRELPGMPTRFTFEQLKVATEEFSKKLGEGGFGSVFEGQLGEERIAIKRLDRAGQGKKEFLAEVETIGSIHHVNLVRLIGFCAEKSERLLVYEYMSRGSLDKWIYYRDGNVPIDWLIRCRIVIDIAKGLAYLHEECRQRIAHLDIKPQNILLDDNFNAKVSDFGLSKLIDRDKSFVITRMRGTPGYLAPEWLTSQITEKADIYSFGVVVVEIISGRKNLDHSQPEENLHLISLLQEKVKNGQLEDLIDKHSTDMQTQKEKVIQMMKLAMWCLQLDSNRRPPMSVVGRVLEGAMDVETDIDYNFIATAAASTSNVGHLGASAPPLASVLSGPR